MGVSALQSHTPATNNERGTSGMQPTSPQDTARHMCHEAHFGPTDATSNPAVNEECIVQTTGSKGSSVDFDEAFAGYSARYHLLEETESHDL